MAVSKMRRSVEANVSSRSGGLDEGALEESARQESLRAGAPGTVGTRVVIRECGNVSPRGRFGEARPAR
ncbi:MAG: hypothetical protein K1X87_06770 [Dehalococcoidia bacterium]|nr:hypothetical protein [Dehalococcoidia bacterium]